MATPVYPLPKRGSNASACRKPSQLLPAADVLVPPLAPTVLCAEPSPLGASMARMLTLRPSGHHLGHLWEPAWLRTSGLCARGTHCAVLRLLAAHLPAEMPRRWDWAPPRLAGALASAAPVPTMVACPPLWFQPELMFINTCHRDSKVEGSGGHTN